MITDFIEADDPFSQADLHKIVQAVGRELPDAYCAFVQKFGGAFVGGLVDGAPDFPILAFFKVEKILSTLDFMSNLKEEGILPFADCELGNLWVFDREGIIYYVNNYGGKTKTHKISADFTDFVSRIFSEDT